MSLQTPDRKADNNIGFHELRNPEQFNLLKIALDSKLTEAGFLKRMPDGRSTIYSLSPESRAAVLHDCAWALNESAHGSDRSFQVRLWKTAKGFAAASGVVQEALRQAGIESDSGHSIGTESEDTITYTFKLPAQNLGETPCNIVARQIIEQAIGSSVSAAMER